MRSEKRRVRTLARVLPVVLAGIAALAAVAGAAQSQYMDDRIFVIVPESERPLTIESDNSTGFECLDSLNELHDFEDIYKSFPHSSHDEDGIYTVILPDTLDIDTVVSAYLDAGCLDTVFKMILVTSLATPNDPYYINTGGDSIEYQWALGARDSGHTRVNQVWDMTTGSSDLVIAHTDCAYFWEHPDMANNLWINAPEDSNGNGTFECWASDSSVGGVYGDLVGDDDDGNGYIDDVIGLKFEDGAQSPDLRCFDCAGTDDPRHGLWVTSIMSATTNNEIGMAGVAGGWGTTKGPRLMSGVWGGGALDDLCNAVEYTIYAGADIINMSWILGRPDLEDTMQVNWLNSILETAYYDSNMICVAGAGNDGDSVLNYPAAFGEQGCIGTYDEKRVVGVGSLYIDSSMCDASTYAKNLYDVAAPGMTWLATADISDPDDVTYGYDPYFEYCATSFATPHVTGILALIWSTFPELTNADVVDRLFDRAEGNTQYFHYGNVDAWASIYEIDESPWTRDQHLFRDVVIDAGDTLWVFPSLGCSEVLLGRDVFKDGADTNEIEIVVNGTLIVSGTESKQIVFRPDTASGVTSWRGIRVGDGGKIIMKWATIQNAYCGIRLEDTDSAYIADCTIEDGEAYGIYSEADTLEIHDITISGMGDGNGIYATGQWLEIDGAVIDSCYKGIWIASDSTDTINASMDDCTIRNGTVAGIMVDVDDIDTVTISESYFSDMDYYGVQIYRGGSLVEVNDDTFRQSFLNAVRVEGSASRVTGGVIKNCSFDSLTKSNGIGVNLQSIYDDDLGSSDYILRDNDFGPTWDTTGTQTAIYIYQCDDPPRIFQNVVTGYSGIAPEKGILSFNCPVSDKFGQES